MNTSTSFQAEPYRLVPGLELGSSSASRHMLSDSSGREDLVLRTLGPRAWRRLYQFRHVYGSAWGEGHGRRLSPGALEVFYRFLESAHFAPGVSPSLFLTDEGHLELCWDSPALGEVQVEFTPAGTEYFLEQTGEEGVAALADTSRLAHRLTSG